MAKSKKKSGKNKKKKSNVIKVNFKGVEGRKHIPEDDYVATIDSFKVEKGDEYDYIAWKFKIESEDKAVDGAVLYTNTTLAPKGLFNLRNMLESMGYEVPNSAMDIDLDALVGESVSFQVVHEDYEDKPRPKIADWLPLGDETEEEGEEEGEEGEEEGEEEAELEEGEEEEEDEEAPTLEDMETMSSKDLVELVEQYELDIDLDDYKTLRKRRKIVTDALIEAEVIEEDD